MFLLFYRMYHIVEFVNSKEVEVVHSNWLEGGESFWPPFVSLAKLRRATKDGVMPGADWTRFRVRVMYSHGIVVLYSQITQFHTYYITCAVRFQFNKEPFHLDLINLLLSDVYEIACAKLLEATITSDLNTEDEDNRPEYMKRKNR